MARLSVQFKLPDGSIRKTSGQEARTLLLLTKKGQREVVAHDFRGDPPIRLPAYTWSLMRKFGLHIKNSPEFEKGGWHGLFVLRTPLEIVASFEPAIPTSERWAA